MSYVKGEDGKFRKIEFEPREDSEEEKKPVVNVIDVTAIAESFIAEYREQNPDEFPEPEIVEEEEVSIGGLLESEVSEVSASTLTERFEKFKDDIDPKEKHGRLVKDTIDDSKAELIDKILESLTKSADKIAIDGGDDIGFFEKIKLLEKVEKLVSQIERVKKTNNKPKVKTLHVRVTKGKYVPLEPCDENNVPTINEVLANISRIPLNKLLAEVHNTNYALKVNPLQPDERQEEDTLIKRKHLRLVSFIKNRYNDWVRRPDANENTDKLINLLTEASDAMYSYYCRCKFFGRHYMPSQRNKADDVYIAKLHSTTTLVLNIASFFITLRAIDGILSVLEDKEVEEGLYLGDELYEFIYELARNE